MIGVRCPVCAEIQVDDDMLVGHIIARHGWEARHHLMLRPTTPDWVGQPDANGDIHCSRLAPKRCVWLEGHYGGCATA